MAGNTTGGSSQPTTPPPESNAISQTSNFTLEAHEVDEELLKPLWIATQIARHPCLSCCGIFVLMMIFSVLDGLVLELSSNETRAYFVESDSYVEQVDAWTLAAEETTESDEDTDAKPQTEEGSLMTVQMMFKLTSYDKEIDVNNPNDTDYWILSPNYLETIIDYENRVIEDKEWKTKYCYVVDTDTYDCSYFSLAQSVAANFDYNYSSMTTKEIKSYISDLHDYSAAYVEAAFNTEYAETGQTYIYRSFLSGGLPIADDNGTYVNGSIVKTSEYSNANDDYDGQEDIFNEWAQDIWIDITVDHNANLKDNGLKIVALIYSVYIDYFNVLLLEGFSYIFLAMLFVFMWMTFHLQSVFLSSLAIFQILLSFPFAYFVYRFICQVTHYDMLSLLIVFVLLGVGADDVFVFTDAWHQSLHFVPRKKDLEQRMTFAYRRASKAMFVTQVTTFFAFLATAFSKIMPISAFGIWAATVVACNYCLVITMYPCILLIHHHYVLPWEEKLYVKICPCCCKETKGGNESQAKKAIEMDQQNTGDTPINNTSNGNNNDNDNDDDGGGGVPPIVARTRSVEEQAEEYRALEKFFGVTWATWVTKYSLYILAFFLILFGLALWRATYIEAQDEDEEWFNDDHYMSLATDFASEFSASEEDGLVSITLAWGIDGIDRDGAVFWDPTDYGSVVWDSSFDMSSPEAQQFLYDTCYNLSNHDLVYSPSSVVCPMDSIRNYTLSRGETFPWTYKNASDSDYDSETQKDEFAWFIYNFTQSEYAYPLTSLSLIYVQTPNEAGTEVPKLKYIAAFIYASLSWDDSASYSRDVRDEWDEYLDDVYYSNDNCPDYVCNPIESSIRWAWLRTMQEFVRSAVQGILIAMPLAFVVLIFSTRNWIIACFATLDIFGIMSCELAVMALQGWKFGVSESIAIVIIIGFSVDYVVHLANAYLESTSPGRYERLSFSLLTMGISVVSGAITTFLAGFMLVWPEIVFFYKMGVLIMTTIVFSIVWAMFFFIAILAKWGPEGDKGRIPFEKVTRYCKRNKSDE